MSDPEPLMGVLDPASSISPAGLAIDRHHAALFIIDFQDKLARAMPAEVLDRAVRNTCVLVAMARRFAMPIVVSQQYPAGLGDTVGEIATALEGADNLHRFDKVEFSACEVESFAAIRESLGEQARQWIVTGMETHICVYQTARGLAAMGHAVHVPRDAVASRNQQNWLVGLDLIARSGAFVTSTETVLFDAVGQAGTEDFKAVAKLVK